MVADIPEGQQAGTVYFIRYDEDAWKGLSPERQEFCKAEWIKRATPIPDIRHVVLKLTPDELFPTYGNEKPYVEWQHAIDRPPECGFTVDVVALVRIVGETTFTPAIMRLAMERELRKTGAKKYRVLDNEGNTLESGSI